MKKREIWQAEIGRLVVAVRAMEAAGLPESADLRELISELQPDYKPHTVELAGKTPNGDYYAKITQATPKLGYNRLHTWELTCELRLQHTSNDFYVEVLSMPVPGIDDTGRSFIGRRWVKHILGNITPRLSTEQLLGRTFRVRFAKDNPNRFQPVENAGTTR